MKLKFSFVLLFILVIFSNNQAQIISLSGKQISRNSMDYFLQKLTNSIISPFFNILSPVLETPIRACPTIYTSLPDIPKVDLVHVVIKILYKKS
ncbi:hypothetical protein DFQ12_0881 [Sphingobacterium detergens]|uniref:Uncharacterized protein n=1 Tax=Sphingobacterium detergens TaxID=1145106 RepID=A0A420BH58_SPHD1|nr:hypothetical protein DFQ12_0881 [Sphingobacterium detergens]